LSVAAADGLMAVLDTRSFLVKYIGVQVKAIGAILVILTADSLRNLDPQIQRQTVLYEMPYPSIEWLVEHARSHFPESQHDCIDRVSEALITTTAETGAVRRIELGDFISIIRVVAELKIEPKGTNWRILLDSLGLLK
jgi:hypothetical protein